MSRRSALTAATVLTALLLSSACNGGGGTPVAESTVAGSPCGAGGRSDPANRDAKRPVARCDKGLPGPRPLPQTVKLRFATAVKAEFIAPLLLAQSKGEFQKENLDVEIVVLPFADSVPQVLSGNLDGTTGSLEAGFFNAVNKDIDLTWVAGNFYPPDAADPAKAQTGLWARKSLFTDPAKPDLAQLKGKKLASNVGFTSSTTYPMAEAFKSNGISVNDVEIVKIPSADQVTALKNGAADMAWLVDPYWLPIANDSNYVLVATQPAGEPLGGFFFGPALVGEKRAAGVAFVRALVRTINTYLAGDYQSDPAAVQAIAETTGATAEAIKGTPSLVFDWEIRAGTTQREQDWFLQLGRVDYKTAIAESELVDRSFYTDAVEGR
ncbi:ABC transporter substrate-binding protein [Dactylosporangium sucinum]|uniref:SsuA/THI5-like domain-containing protein n=1 Tax=Dactylosporangium sucinum TaxID=1424081 RepID=A0A917U7W8_9ACTN|nr:ABC transporter substrate-binding protein [Dactylosporangium sucinum]GGM58893.1 hypothetical protein GCM10007977_070540 [Dactylosporangium sucinum]